MVPKNKKKFFLAPVILKTIGHVNQSQGLKHFEPFINFFINFDVEKYKE